MSSRRPRRLVLVVEDNHRIITFLRFLLESEGYEVVAVPDSPLARQALESPPSPINIMILDVADGLDLLQQLRLEGKTAPIVFLTATEAKLFLCLMTNAGSVLTKNVLIEQVWGDGYEETGGSLATFIKKLRQKIEANPKVPQHIRNVRGAGCIFWMA